ncbi:hypothetical protein IV203_008634 [Nitzschia inconspicua]|uniref:Uncharacterized protein n=1 Tax=Nitzschia inconspicua TaxID=303405 RepID=A0A9K3PMW0_9STRA|nr:hypothetical protein IV203_008634 [Nitzschia inconspicua]
MFAKTSTMATSETKVIAQEDGDTPTVDIYKYKDLNDQMIAEIEAMNPKNETTSGRERNSGELLASPTNDLSNEVIFLDDESETAQPTYNDD